MARIVPSSALQLKIKPLPLCVEFFQWLPCPSTVIPLVLFRFPTMLPSPFSDPPLRLTLAAVSVPSTVVLPLDCA